MADTITGRVWALDTVAQLVTTDAVHICGIAVTWKVGSAGVLLLTEASPEDVTGMTILDASTLAASSAAAHQMTQWFPVEGVFLGLRKSTMTDIASLYVYTK